MTVGAAELCLNFNAQDFRLRDYQQAAVDAGVRYFTDPEANYGALMVLPTGSGKSLVIAGMADRLDSPTLIFQPTREILEQNHAKLLACGHRASIYSASMNSKRISGLTLATIGSVKNVHALFNEFKYIIIDECHYVNPKGGMYYDFLTQHGGKVIGLTATPYRLVSYRSMGSILKFLTRTRPRIFEKLIHVTQNGDLFSRGYLAKIEYRNANEFDHKSLKVNSTGADYTDSSVRWYYGKIGFSDKLYREVMECLANGRKNILIFTRFIEESKALVGKLGGLAEMVTGDTPSREREDIITRFRSGKTKVVANVGVLTHGFDFPELETIILARPTMSLALYYQMIGRGIRIHPGKEYTLVSDLCRNYNLFGRVEDLRLYQTKPGLWVIGNGKRQLTNTFYGNRFVDLTAGKGK